MRHRITRRAFTIYEMLFAIGLMTLIATIAQPFTANVIKSMGNTRAQATANAQFDNAISMLRRDVWQSVSITVLSGQELLLTQADHRQIRWKFGEDQHLRQTGVSTIERDWGAMPAKLEFTLNPAVLHLKVADGNHFLGTTYCMVSPVMMAMEAHP